MQVNCFETDHWNLTLQPQSVSGWDSNGGLPRSGRVVSMRWVTVCESVRTWHHQPWQMSDDTVTLFTPRRQNHYHSSGVLPTLPANHTTTELQFSPNLSPHIEFTNWNLYRNFPVNLASRRIKCAKGFDSWLTLIRKRNP